jgi:hypothetical protein
MAFLALCATVFGLAFVAPSMASASMASASHCPCEDASADDARDEAREGADEDGDPCSDDPCSEDCSHCSCCGAPVASFTLPLEHRLLSLPPPATLRVARPDGEPAPGVSHDIFQPPRALR